MAIASFTSSDWFQILYPLLLFGLGLLVGDRRAANQIDVAAAAVSVVQIVEIPVPTAAPKPPVRHERPAGGSTDDEDMWSQLALFFIAALVTVAAVAYAYVRWRQVLLIVASGFLALTLGVVTGTVRRRIQLGMFAGDWGVLSICIVFLGAAAVASGYFIVHPLAAPGAYSVLYDAYREEGWSAMFPPDSNAWLFAYQAIGALLLVLASATLLFLSVSCVAKGALIAGATPSRVRVWLAGRVRRPLAMISLLGLMLVLLVLSFLMGTGYMSRWGDSPAPDTPKFLVPAISVRGDVMVVQGVATANGVLSISVATAAGRRRSRRRPRSIRRNWTITRGRNRQSLTLGRLRPVRVRLTPGRRNGPVGNAVRF